jgi:hypothetical protein
VTPARVYYERWDPAANKSVIVLGRDGLFALGYSGPGFIKGAPTDDWIAEVVAGEDVSDLGAIRVSQGMSMDRVLAVRLPELARRVDEAKRAGQLTEPLSIGFVGLRWKELGKLAWPAYGRIGWDEDHDRYGYEMSPQRWGYEEGKFVTGATGFSRNVAQKLLTPVSPVPTFPARRTRLPR